jgi:hypothetical protein
MKIKKIEQSEITASDIQLYKDSIKKLKGFVFTANDINLNKRIISIRLGNIEDELTLVNPKVLQVSDKPLVYFEKDFNKNKVRKTVRYPYLLIETDNLGNVEFKADNQNGDWKNSDEFFGDAGLLECVLAQRAIDAINGIDITNPIRAYSDTVVKEKEPGRNDKLMLQGPDGDMIFVKYKKAESYIKIGYKTV